MFVKICGLRTPDDVSRAVADGADAVGFMFTASPRRVEPRAAAELVTAAGNALTVGVFTTESRDEIRTAVRDSGVSAVQLHGPHPPADFAALRDLPVRLIRAQAADSDPDTACGAYGEDMLIVDAPRPGSGESWDYSAVPGARTGKWMLAGGLTPRNVAAAIAAARPWGVDVSSGVEISRGVKDPALIREFLTAAKSAES